MNDKLKFYRSTLVQITKGLIGYTPMHKLAEDADKITKEIMQKVDEFEQEKTNMWSPNYDPSYSMTTTLIDHLGFEGNKQKVNPDYLKTDPNIICASNETKDKLKDDLFKTAQMRTIVDNGPQYQANQKPYGTLGEHWKELMDLFDVKDCFGKDWEDIFIRGIDFCKDNEKKCSSLYETFYEKIKSVADKLGIEFIEDFVKACEKCEE